MPVDSQSLAMGATQRSFDVLDFGSGGRALHGSGAAKLRHADSASGSSGATRLAGGENQGGAALLEGAEVEERDLGGEACPLTSRTHMPDCPPKQN
jgi:hypothetical protein